MKKRELLKHATCDACGLKIGASGLPLFYTVTVARYGIRMDRVRRSDGLAACMGNETIADVMGADEDLTTTLMQPVTLTVCETCSTTSDCIALIALAMERADQKPEAAS